MQVQKRGKVLPCAAADELFSGRRRERDGWLVKCLGSVRVEDHVANLRGQFGLYKIFVNVEAAVHKSTILSFPRPPALPTLVQYYRTIIGQYTTPLPTSRLYAIHHTVLVITIV